MSEDQKLKANHIAACGADAMNAAIEGDDLVGYVVVVVRYWEPTEETVRAPVKELALSTNLPTKEAAFEALEFALETGRSNKAVYTQTTTCGPNSEVPI